MNLLNPMSAPYLVFRHSRDLLFDSIHTDWIPSLLEGNQSKWSDEAFRVYSLSLIDLCLFETVKLSENRWLYRFGNELNNEW